MLLFCISLLLFTCAPAFGAITESVPMDRDSVAQCPCCEISPDHAEVGVEMQRALHSMLFPKVLIDLVTGYHGKYLFPQFLAIHDEDDRSYQVSDWGNSIYIFTRAKRETLSMVAFEIHDYLMPFPSRQQPLEKMQFLTDKNKNQGVTFAIWCKLGHTKMYVSPKSPLNTFDQFHAIQETSEDAVNKLCYLSYLQTKILPIGHAEYRTGVRRSVFMLPFTMGLQEFGRRYRNTYEQVAAAYQSPQFALIDENDKEEAQYRMEYYEQAKEKAAQLESLKPGMGVLFHRGLADTEMHESAEKGTSWACVIS